MAFDRDSTLKKAEKLLRQGRLDAAIAEYLKVVDDEPGDWASANALGDLYGRAGRIDDAVAQYARIAEHFMRDGYLPRAAALYKKILKIRRDDERAQLQLAEIAAQQGLLADARAHFSAVASRRRARGDRRGEAEITVRLGSIDPADVAARLIAARTLEDMGEEAEAAARFKALHGDLAEQDRPAEALDALRQFVRLMPGDAAARRVLARAAFEADDAAGLREFLDRETAGGDPVLLLALARIELAAGERERFRELLPALLAADRDLWPAVLEMGWSMLEEDRNTAFDCVCAAADAAASTSRADDALGALHEFLARAPGDIPALQKIIEVCVDAGLEPAMTDAQVKLADAYLASEHADEARVITEDLIAREPWEPSHLERFRRALSMLGEPDPDAVIALRLGGDAPFTTTDPFFDPSELPPVPPAVLPAAAIVPPSEDVAAEQAAASSGSLERTGNEQVGGQEEIDLTAALGGPGKPPPAEVQPAALDGVFQQMREQAQAAPDYSAQHLTLGRTYLEIGMIQEGISALKTAARSPRSLFEAAATLGRFYQQRDDTVQAIEWLERAAEAAPSGTDEGRALLYELGVALESVGERARALAVFLELQSDVYDYRDVPSRIDRLGRVQPGG